MQEKLINQIKSSFYLLDNLFSDEELNFFISTPIDDLIVYHFGLGTWIRNNILLKKGELYVLFIENGFCNEDEMSALIIKSFYEYKKGTA